MQLCASQNLGGLIMSKIAKSRYWSIVVYPESAPPDWRDKLRQTMLPCAISPLHDRDLDGTGAAKKPHWHVLLVWGNTVAHGPVKAIAETLNAPSPELVRSCKGMYRYLTHQDDPDKHQYDPATVEHLGGFAPAAYWEADREDIERDLDRIEDYVLEHDVLEYADLMERLASEGLTDLRRLARRNTIHLSTYISSRRHRRQTEGDNHA